MFEFEVRVEGENGEERCRAYRSYGLIRAESGVQGLLVIGSWARV